MRHVLVPLRECRAKLSLSQPLQVDPQLILQLVTYHSRVFGGGSAPSYIGLSRASGEAARTSNGATVVAKSKASGKKGARGRAARRSRQG